MDVEPDWKAIVETGWGFKNDESRLIEYFTEIVKQNPSARAKFELANALDFIDRESEAIPLYGKRQITRWIEKRAKLIN